MPRRNPFNSIRFVENFNAYLDNLNSADLQKLFQTKGNRRLYKKKDFFVRQHAVSRVAGWVESGTFHYLYHDAAGKVHVVGYAFAQEFVCDYASFVQVRASKVSIQALADCVVYELPLAELLAFWESDSAAQQMGRRVAENLYAAAYDRFLDTYNSPEIRYKKLMQRCPGLKEVVPLRSIASYLGVTPETISHIRKRI